MAELYTQHRTMREIFRIVFSRWKGAALICALTVAAVAVATWYSPRVYETKVTLMVPITPAEQEIAGGTHSDLIWEVVLKTQYEILMGPTVLSRALARQQNAALARPPGLDALRKTDMPAGILGEAPPAPPDPQKLARIQQARVAADAIAQAAERIPQEKLAELRRNVRMEVPGGQTVGKSQVFTLYVRAHDPQSAKRLADLLTEEFIFRYHELVVEVLGGRLSAAQENLHRLSSDYEPARAAEAEFLNRVGGRADAALLISLIRGAAGNVGALDVENTARVELDRLQSQRASLDKLRNEFKQSLDQLKTLDPTQPLERFPTIPRDVRTANAAITPQLDNLVRKMGQQAELRQRFTADSVPVTQINAEIADLEQQLIQVLDAELAAINWQVNSLDAEIAEYQRNLKPLAEAPGRPPEPPGTLITELRRIDAEVSHLETLWNEQVGQANQARKAYEGAIGAPQITPTDTASVPKADEYVRPIVWLNLTIAAVVGAMLALAYVFLADFYDHSVRTTEDVERYLGVPVLASMKRVRGRPLRQ